MTDSLRQPHAVLDLESRRLKGMKIERLLNLARRDSAIRMLEVGTGSGGIAHYFGTQADLVCEVEAVDVLDNRQVKEGYRFHVVAGIGLPYPESNFDVVLTNHVIEHVGDAVAQRSHLAEIYRVLKPEGVAYLAVPNRWMLVEPHYRVPFLSWLPRALRTPYLRATGRGKFYDCEPLQVGQIEKLLAEAGFIFENLCVPAMRLTFEIERPYSIATRLLRRVPDRAMTPWRRLIPTLIYALRKPGPIESACPESA